MRDGFAEGRVTCIKEFTTWADVSFLFERAGRLTKGFGPSDQQVLITRR